MVSSANAKNMALMIKDLVLALTDIMGQIVINSVCARMEEFVTKMENVLVHQDTPEIVKVSAQKVNTVIIVDRFVTVTMRCVIM
jgi:hypothetical protein